MLIGSACAPKPLRPILSSLVIGAAPCKGMDNLTGYDTGLGYEGTDLRYYEDEQYTRDNSDLVDGFDEELDALPRYGVCAECKQAARFQLIDVGIGSYEFWGATGNHVEMVWASECCEGEEQEKEQAD